MVDAGIELLTIVLSIATASVLVTWRLSSLLHKIDKRFDALEHRFDVLEERVSRIEVAIREAIVPVLVIVTEKSPDISKLALEKFSKIYFGDPNRKLSNPTREVEERKKALVLKARLGTLIRSEAIEVKNLLEKQKKQHDASGDVAGAILAGLILVLILGLFASLFGEED